MSIKSLTPELTWHGQVKSYGDRQSKIFECHNVRVKGSGVIPSKIYVLLNKEQIGYRGSNVTQISV